MTKTKHWFKWPLMGLLLAAATAASAGLVTISPSTGSYNVGNKIVFRVSDGNPTDMCTNDNYFGLCVGDFRVSFDPTKLSFVPAIGFIPDDGGFTSSVTSLLDVDWTVMGGGALGGEFDVSIGPSVVPTPPTSGTDLFSFTLRVNEVEPGTSTTVSVTPKLFACEVYDYVLGYCGDDENTFVTYAFSTATTDIEISGDGNAVPEPTSYALVMLAFAAMGGVARRKGRRSV